MEETIKNETETVKNDAPKPGTKDALKAENDALKAELEAMKAKEAELEAMKGSAPIKNVEPEVPKQKMVKIRIPRTKTDQEDVFVSVNLNTYAIKRGVDVEVPDFVAEVLRHQEEMMETIMLFDEAHKKGD